MKKNTFSFLINWFIIIGLCVTVSCGRSRADVLPNEWIKSHQFVYDDTLSVDENIAIAERLAQTYIDKFGTTDKINTPERQALRHQITDELYGDGARIKNREAFIIIGLPASGKSTFADPLVSEQGALLIDSDDAKKKMPEYNNGILATAVHEESSNIAEEVFGRAIANSDNIIMPVVGKTFNTLNNRIDVLKKASYNVKLIYVDLPVDKALERVKQRFKEEGRLVSPEYLLSVGTKPKENYDKLKETNAVDSYEAWNADVPRGSQPILIESSAQQERHDTSWIRIRKYDMPFAARAISITSAHRRTRQIA